MSAQHAAIFAMIGGLLAGCGSSVSKSKADVTITLDGEHHGCTVALANEAQGSSVACADVAAFLKDELRVHSGAVYELRAGSAGDVAQFKTVSSALNNAGYRAAQ